MLTNNSVNIGDTMNKQLAVVEHFGLIQAIISINPQGQTMSKYEQVYGVGRTLSKNKNYDDNF